MKEKNNWAIMIKVIFKTERNSPVLVRIETVTFSERQWIDAGENPVVRHEGGTPSNNLIKDVPHRATVFVGPTLKSLSFIFS